MLLLRAVCKSVGAPARRILNDISLSLERGEYIAIMGESGVGKSTLLNLIAGLDVPDSGAVVLDGRDIAQLDDDARTLLRRAQMGFVFQAFHLLPYLTVARNISLPLVLNGRLDALQAPRIHELIRAVGLEGRDESYPSELSGGEMQRVAIARALAHRPALVLADEPTGNLDPGSSRVVLELLRAELKRENAAGILVTHSLAAAATTDRILKLTAEGLFTA